MDSCRIQRPPKVFCFQAAYHGALVRRFWTEQCWVLLAVFSELNGGSHKVANRGICSCLRRITSLSTVFRCIPCWAVCWACLLKSFGAEQILHTRWPTEIFAHACVEIKSMSTDFMCIPSRNKAWIAAASSARPKYSAFRQLIMERWCGVFGLNSAGFFLQSFRS